MSRDLRQICLSYEEARIELKACEKATQPELDEAENHRYRIRERVMTERRRFVRDHDRAEKELMEALAEVGPIVVMCENYCYFLLDGNLHRRHWQASAAVALDQHEADEDEEEDDCGEEEYGGDLDDLKPDDVVLDATSLGKAHIRHLQKTDMRGSFDGRVYPESNGRAEPLDWDLAPPKADVKAQSAADDLLSDLAAHYEVPDDPA